MFNFNITLSENEMLALIEVINRAYEISYPDLMYHSVLIELGGRLLKEVNKICEY